jgi:ATP-binding cassette subfamily A (ABC1) protein 3
LLFGEDLSDLAVRDKLRPQLGVCPQHDILFPELTVCEHLELFRAIKGRGCGSQSGDTFASVDDLISRVDLEGKGNNLSRELSGGQKRKLCVALALMGNPGVVTLDEPSSGQLFRQ